MFYMMFAKHDNADVMQLYIFIKLNDRQQLNKGVGCV